MSNVNSDAKEWTDTFIYIWESILAVWAALPIELKAYILTMFTIFILLQYIKKAFLSSCSKKDRIKWLWVSGMPIALLLSYAGWVLSYGKIHSGYWIMTGLTVSTVAMGVHRVTVDYVWPFIAFISKVFKDRFLLMVRGNAG